jgi:RNA polymerase sigma-70 factor (ECF subfamily)
VLNNQDKFADNINFKGWVLTIMKNIFINNYRKIVRNQTVIDKSEDLFKLNLSQNSGYETPEGAYSIDEISSSIASFTNEYRIPLSMHIQGYKYEEIATVMELPLGTVKSRIFLARKRLQEQLSDYR